MLLNDVKITRDERFTFIKTQKIFVPRLVTAIVFAILALLPVKLDAPSIIFKIVFAAVFVVLLVSALNVRRDGLYVYTDGKVKIISGIGKDEFELIQIKRIAFNFTEWENEEFSAQFKIVFEDGEILNQNYAKKFEDTGNHMGLSAYTMSKNDMEAICKRLEAMNICNISVIDFNKDITYQYIKK